MASHNYRPFIPSEANREEPRTLHNAWRKFYEPEEPPPPPVDAPYPFSASPSVPPPPARDWRDPPIPVWKPKLPVEGNSRRWTPTAPSSGRGNMLPPPPRGYDPLSPNPSTSSNFLERPTWGAPRGGDWLDRPPESDHWSPGTASSSARARDRDWDRGPRRPRGWSGSRQTVSPSYSHADRPLLEPSQAWKDRERQLSLDRSTATVPSGSGVPDFQTRRFHQPPPPPPPPPLPGRTFASQFSSLSNQYSPASFPRRSAPRRRQHRISARISARPKREPSPSSSESSAPSRSRSRSSRSPYIHPGWGRGTAEPVDDTGATVPSQKRPSTLAGPIVGPSSVPSSSFTFRPAPSPPRAPESPSRSPLSSPSSHSWSSQSSIRSSVHSSPRLVATELEPAITRRASPEAADTELVPAAGAAPSPQEDAEFELPGMRFLKDGALKPGLEPPGLMTDNGDSHTAPDAKTADNEAALRESPQAVAVKDDITIPHVVATEVSEHPQALGRDSFVEEAHSSALSPLSVLSPSLDHSLVSFQASQSSPLSHKQPVESLKEHDTSQVAQKREVAAEAAQQETSHPEPANEFDLALAASSSPLSEPTPLSPPTYFSEKVEQVDEESSIDTDDDSSSSPSTSSGPADDIAAALRVFVKARDGKDLQTRNERYSPILRANHALLDPPYTRISTLNEDLVSEVLADSLHGRLEAHAAVSQTLLERFTKQAEELATRTRRLRAEYKLYHDRWVANCRKLDQSMASSASQGVEGLPVPSGRVTRRSATFGDTVRSDLEMEQIIASLGNEDMTDPNVLAIRNTAIIPDLVSTDPFAVAIPFDDDNGLVDDPAEFFNTHEALGRWTDEEKQIFVQKYGVYPKQFGAIASFLPNKTSAQCVMFYYMHKKELVDFRAAISQYGPKRRRRGGRKAGKGKGNALLADIVKPTRAGADEGGISHKHSDRFLNVGCGRFPTRQPPVIDDNEGESSRRPSASVVERGSRGPALQQEAMCSDSNSGHSNRPSWAATRIPISEDDGDVGTIVVPPAQLRRKLQARTYIRPSIKLRVPAIVEPSTKFKRAEKVKEKTFFSASEEETDVLTIVPTQPRRKLQARNYIVQPATKVKRAEKGKEKEKSVSEDEEDVETVVAPPAQHRRKLFARKYITGPRIKRVPEAIIQAEKGKEKEKNVSDDEEDEQDVGTVVAPPAQPRRIVQPGTKVKRAEKGKEKEKSVSEDDEDEQDEQDVETVVAPPAQHRRKLFARNYITMPRTKRVPGAIIRAEKGKEGEKSVLDDDEDEQDVGTVVASPVQPRPKIQPRNYIIRPQIKLRLAESLAEAAKHVYHTEKGKEKERRPPGRPPKKSKERAKALEKAGASSLNSKPTSYVWSKGEEAVYLELIARHGKDFEKIAGEMPAKTALQCRNYFRNHAMDLDLERIAKKSGSYVTPAKGAVSNSSSASLPASEGIEMPISKINSEELSYPSSKSSDHPRG